MNYSAAQLVDAGEMLPQFTLPAAGGGMVALWQYKQRQQFILLLVHGPDSAEARALLARFAERYAALREQETEVLALLHLAPEALLAAQARLGVPYPLLADETGETLRRLAGWDAGRDAPEPTLLVADRYGALYTRYSAKEERDLPTPEVVLKDLEYMAIQCPE